MLFIPFLLLSSPLLPLFSLFFFNKHLRIRIRWDRTTPLLQGWLLQIVDYLRGCQVLVQSEPIAIQFQHSLNPLTDYERPVRNLRNFVKGTRVKFQNIRNL